MERPRLGSMASRIPGDPVGRAQDAAFLVRVGLDSGLLAPIRPDKAGRMAITYARWGNNPATAASLAAIRYPDETYVIDERGSLTFGEMDRRSNALARALAEEGLGAGDGLAIMARNHRGFIEATLAGSKLGCSVLYLNTMFGGKQLADVVEREGPKVLVYDAEFSGLLEGVRSDVRRVVSWQDEDVDSGGTVDATIDELIAGFSDDRLSPPKETPRFIILTSGTTGTPKGAQRGSPSGLSSLAGLIDAIPFHAREKMMIAAPLFHSWGFTHLVLSLSFAHTIVLRRRFDPEDALRAVDESGAQVLAVVPVMLQRILQLPEETLDKYKLPALRITSSSGSALPGELALRWMDRFGDTIYNLYGSTEVAYATVAGPQDLRAAPGTAGRPPRGTVVRIVDEDGKDKPPGETGRIFVGNEMAFEGYTGGGGKDALGDLLSSGDVGHFDDDGRLFIDGRDDEMIVSGGENVFPREVEDLLADHDAIKEAAVIGVDDDEYGQRLKGFVVVREGNDVSEQDLKAYVKSNLSGYKVPREIVFIDSLPRNATGKVLKRELV
jgi:acyl-CoA synthetase (AMP-forming)/AMP-acid ligase II